MGQVWSAIDTITGRNVAIKVARAWKSTMITALKREYRVASELIHPNLVAMHALYADSNTCAICMEWIDGKPISGAIPIDQIRPIFSQLTAGLSAVHQAGLIHGDLKGNNVLRTESGRIVLLDFGLARIGNPKTPVNGGTVAYMSPEYLSGSNNTPSGDIYALGVMLYEALTGQLPVSCNMPQHKESKASRWFAHPQVIAPNAPPELAELAWQLIHPEPEQRPSLQKVREVLQTDQTTPQLSTWDARPALEDALRETIGIESTNVQCIRVTGAPGTGKTALVRRVLLDLHRTVLWGRCEVLEQVAFRGLDGVADDTLRFLHRPRQANSAMHDDLAAASALFPQLGGRPGMAPWVAGERNRAFAAKALARVHNALAAERDLVIVIDDVQWMGRAASEVFVEWLAELNGPILLILIGRTPLNIDKQFSVITIDVPALDTSDHTTLGSSPFVRPAPSAGPERERWLGAVHTLFQTQPSMVRAAARWVALAGGPIAQSHLETLGISEGDVRAAVTANLLTLQTDEAYRIVALRQAALGPALLDLLPPQQSEYAHLGRVLLAGSPRWALAARDLLQRADLHPAAVEAEARAGFWALRCGAFEDARALLTSVQEAQLPTEQWAIALGQAMLALGHIDSARKIWTDALSSTTGLIRVQLYAQLANLVFGHGETSEGLKLLTALLESVGETLPRSIVMSAWRAWGARVEIQSPTDLQTETDANVRLEAIWHVGRVLLVVAPISASLLLARHQRLAAAHGNAEHRILSASWQWWSKISQGRSASKEESALGDLLVAHQRLMEEQPRLRAELDTTRAAAHLGAARLANGGDAFEAAAASWRSLAGDCWEFRYCLSGMWVCRIHERPLAESDREIRAFRAYSLSMGDRRSSVVLALGAGIFPDLYLSGSGEQNLRYIDQAIEEWGDALPPESEFRAIYARVQAVLATGDAERALKLLESTPLRVRALRVFPMIRFALDGLHARILAHFPRRSAEKKAHHLLEGLINTPSDLTQGLAEGVKAGFLASNKDTQGAIALRNTAYNKLIRARQHLLAAALVADDTQLRAMGFADPTGFRRLVFGPGAIALHALAPTPEP